MSKSSFNIPAAFLLMMLSCLGCKDISNVTSSDEISAIKSVIPAQGAYGATVRIGGIGFGGELGDQQVLFNKTAASIESLSDTTILTMVPFDATSGPVKIVTDGDTLEGPAFTVDTTKNVLFAIDNVNPVKGRIGDDFSISGKGFEPDNGTAKVFVGNVPVPVLSANDTTITARISAEAQTGSVFVVADEDTAMGPLFTVIRQQISGISPTEGPVGTGVTISGSGFSSVVSENIVTFSGNEAPVETASENEILAFVPEGTTTGSVNVTIGEYTAVGPTFTIQQPKSLQVAVQTEGTNQDDSYTLSVAGQEDVFIKPNDEMLYSGIYENNVQVTLKDVAENCRVEGENPRSVSLSTSEVTNTNFTVDCTVDLRGKIVFSTDRDNYGELYMQDPNSGFPPLRITETTDYYEAEPAISPDGLRIAFVNTRGGREILVMDSDGSDIQKLTNSGWNTAPSWSPDGSQIVFARSSNSDAPSDIFIMNSDGSNVQNITNTGTAREMKPDWSPDGSLIVYESFLATDTEIVTIHPDGTNKNQITDNEVFDFEPEWSPSGDRIAFVRDITETGRNIHIMNSDGTNAQKLTYFNGTELSPSWSPDGSMIAYSRYVDGYYHISIFSVEYNDILSSPYTSSNDRSPHWNFR